MGARLRAAREKHGWSLEHLGELSGVHWSGCGDIERGKRNVSLHTLLVLTDALGVDPADIVRDLHAPPRLDQP